MAITLSNGIPTWFIDQFANTLYHVCQRKESKFGQAVRVEPVLSAEDKAFDMLGSFSLAEKTGRNVQTPTIDPETQRRWVNTTPYHNAVLYDKDDDLNMIIDPTSDFVQAFRMAVNRQKDAIILAAFEATVTSGRRAGSTITWASQDGNVKYTGKDTGRTIAHDCASGNCVATDTGMTVEKIELIKEYFAHNDVDEDIPIWCAISPRQGTNLFGQEEYVSYDYARDKPLATGRILRNWMGLNWIVTSGITVGSSNDVDADTNVYECWAWAQDGIILGVQDNVSVEISTRSDLSYSQQVYVHMNMGAMRMDEDKVIKIECQ
jgi:hypothetical protein